MILNGFISPILMNVAVLILLEYYIERLSLYVIIMMYIYVDKLIS